LKKKSSNDIIQGMSTIKIRKGMKFRLEPNTAQKADVVMFAAHNRAQHKNSITIWGCKNEIAR